MRAEGHLGPGLAGVNSCLFCLFSAYVRIERSVTSWDVGFAGCFVHSRGPYDDLSSTRLKRNVALSHCPSLMMHPLQHVPYGVTTQVLMAVVCTQFIRVYDLSTNAAAPVHTFYLPATAEDASNDGAGSCIRDVDLVPPRPPPDTMSTLSGEAAAEGWGVGISAPPALLGTAIVLTGSGRLYAKGIPSPSSYGSRSGGGSGGGAYAHDGEIRHKLVVPPTMEEAQSSPGGEGDAGKDNGGAGGSGSGMGGGVGGGDNGEGDAGGDNGSESDGSRGRSESVGGSGREEDEEVESPVSGSAEESPSYSSYLQAFAGCDFDDVVEDSPDENLIFAEPGLRRRGAAWAAAVGASAVPSSSAASEVMASETDRILTMSPAHLARTAASESTATTAAASAGSLHFSHRMDVLVVARGGRSTLCLRLRGTGATTAVTGGFVLLPRSNVGSSGSGRGRGSAFVDVSATPTSQGVGTNPTQEGAASAAAKAAAMSLEAKSCLPPYTRFLDYWDGADDLAGEDGTAAVTSVSAAMVCVAEGRGKVAAGGGKVKSDRVLAMKIGGGSGDRRAVSLQSNSFLGNGHPTNDSFVESSSSSMLCNHIKIITVEKGVESGRR